MPFAMLRQKLIARGYWDAAGEGGAGEGGASAENTNTNTNTNNQGDKSSNDGTSGDDDSDDDSSDDGKMSDADAKLLKDMMKHKKRAKEAEKRAARLEEELKKFEGVDLNQVQSLLQEKRQSETKKLEEQGAWDALKKQMIEENSKQLKSRDDKIAELESRLAEKNSVIDKLTLGSQFSNSNFILNELNLSPAKTRVLFGDHFELEEGEVVAYNKPRGAKDRAPLVDGLGEPLKFEDAIRKIVEADPDRDRLIKSKVKPGSNSGTSNSSAGKSTDTGELRGLSKISKALNQK